MPKLKVGSSNYKNTSTRATISGHRFKSRAIYNTSKGTSESTNWRLDFYRFNNVSYAQVLKTAVKNKVTNIVKINNVTTKIRDGALHSNSKTVKQQYIPSIKVPSKNDSKCRFHKSTAKAKKGQIKVSHPQAWEKHFQCKNRFAVLPVDAVVSNMVSESIDNASDINKPEGQVPDEGDTSKATMAKSQIASTDDASDKKSLVLPPIKEGGVDSCTKYDLPLRIKNKSMT